MPKTKHKGKQNKINLGRRKKCGFKKNFSRKTYLPNRVFYLETEVNPITCCRRLLGKSLVIESAVVSGAGAPGAQVLAAGRQGRVPPPLPALPAPAGRQEGGQVRPPAGTGRVGARVPGRVMVMGMRVTVREGIRIGRTSRDQRGSLAWRMFVEEATRTKLPFRIRNCGDVC